MNWLDEMHHAKNERSRLGRDFATCGVLYIPARLTFDERGWTVADEEWWQGCLAIMMKPLAEGPAHIICGIGGPS